MSMQIGIRPVSAMEDLELRRDRLAELIELDLVSPTLSAQLRRSLVDLDRQIGDAQAGNAMRLAA